MGAGWDCLSLQTGAKGRRPIRRRSSLNRVSLEKLVG